MSVGDGFPLSRRSFLLAAASGLALAACRRPGGQPGVLRIGLVANLTHAPVLAALASGALDKALAPTKIEARIFRAGPRVVEALIGGAIDIGITGPAPVLFTYARHGDGSLGILSGVASGGASLIAAKGIALDGVDAFRQKAFAVTQVGTTQDISFRTHLRRLGLKPKEEGGDVTLHALAGAVIKQQMSEGRLAGAWVPEPWASRLVLELGARRVLDERDLWAERRFATAIAVSTPAFVLARGLETDTFLRLLHAEIDAATQDPARVEALAYEELRKRTGNAGPRKAFHEAMGYVDFTRDPLDASIRRLGADAAQLGFAPVVDLQGLFHWARA